MRKMILFNGAKGSGKSTACDHLLVKYANSTYARCKDKLFELTMELFNVDPQNFYEVYEDRAEKELPNPLFTISAEAFDLLDIRYDSRTFAFAYIDKDAYWISCRMAMIFVSEVLIKPYFGEDYFGKARAESICGGYDLYLDDSVGFYSELEPLFDKFDPEDILMIQIKNRGDFNGDSRSWVVHDKIRVVEIDNSQGLDELLMQVDYVVEGFLDD